MNIKLNWVETKAKDIDVGDFIKSFNIETEETEPKKVIELFEPYVDETRQIVVKYGNNGHITVSKTHPLLVKRNDNWIYIDTVDAIVGDICKSENSITKIVGFESSSEEPNFIDFTIKDNNNYYASNQSSDKFIVVHNSCCIYFQWWNIDFKDLIVLKSNGGTEESRARGLKYAVKINDLLIQRWINDEDVSLFDPKDVPELFELVNGEFEKKYIEYENKASLKRKTIPARELFYDIMKERTETGNIYLFHEENVNNHNMVGSYINSSNLCMEILEKSRPSELIDEELLIRESGERQIRKKYKAGEIALCNLSSINLLNYYSMTNKQKDVFVYKVVSFMDNTINIAKYPVKEGMNSNQLYRYLGIGVSNFTNLLASRGIVIDTQEALEFTHKLFDDLTYRIISASCDLAMERGSFAKFGETNWAKGIVPIHMANKKALKLTKYKPDMKKWNELGRRIKKNGIRNALLMAIAPTATSGKAINATESILPIINFLYKEDGTANITCLAPNFKKHNQYYKKAFECDQYKLIELAAVRQMYLDQAQSIDLYFTRPDSYMELMKVHLYAFDIGVKTLYYLQQVKGSDMEICESCT